jgi:hypothetical protein
MATLEDMQWNTVEVNVRAVGHDRPYVWNASSSKRRGSRNKCQLPKFLKEFEPGPFALSFAFGPFALIFALIKPE